MKDALTNCTSGSCQQLFAAAAVYLMGWELQKNVLSTMARPAMPIRRKVQGRAFSI